MTAGPWPSRAAFESWWQENVRAFNRLAVTDPEEWERIAQAVEDFQRKHPQ
jgi:hypothetical protein